MDSCAQIFLGALESSELTDAEIDFFQRESPAGLTLFARNLSSPDGSELPLFIEQLNHLKQTHRSPLLIAIDQEGGRVARLKGEGLDFGPAMFLAGQANCDDTALSTLEKYGYHVGAALKKKGVNINFAPVVDVLTSQDNVCIGDRAFGTTPQQVSLRAGAFLSGQNRAGVLSCLKHFPGQGNGRFDTHFLPCPIPRSRDEIFAQDLPPFVELHKLASMIMVSHSIYSDFDDKPASLSSVICQDLARKHLGFQGVLIADDLNMKAVCEDPERIGEVAEASLMAGCDLILICRYLQPWQKAIDHIRNLYRRSPAVARRVDEAAIRVSALQRRLL